VVSRNDIFALVSRVRAATNEYLVGELEARGVSGLAPSHGDILAALFRSGEMGMTELADAIRRRKNTLTVLVAKLEVSGFIARHPDPEDARRSLVSLTPAGEALREPFARISRALVSKGLRGVGESEVEATSRCLETILDNLRG
jgi:MarR family transcriptional regulator, organic hydroperoxide resistance regulator